MIKIGNYIIYPAFFILIGVIFLLILVFVAMKNILENKKQENSINRYYEITRWQKTSLIKYLNEYIEKNNLNEYFIDLVKMFSQYAKSNKYWNLDELLDLKENLLVYITLMIFEISKDKYSEGNIDVAILCLHTIDFINGGMDNPDYYKGDYPWFGDDVPEQRNSDEMSEEEVKTLHVYTSAVSNLYALVDEDLEKIPENVPVLDFCKKLSTADFIDAAEDLYSIIDIQDLKEETRDVVAKSLFNDISILINSVFDKDEENFVQYLDEYRRYQVRALASAIDGQLYSDVIATINA